MINNYLHLDKTLITFEVILAITLLDEHFCWNLLKKNCIFYLSPLNSLSEPEYG